MATTVRTTRSSKRKLAAEEAEANVLEYQIASASKNHPRVKHLTRRKRGLGDPWNSSSATLDSYEVRKSKRGKLEPGALEPSDPSLGSFNEEMGFPVYNSLDFYSVDSLVSANDPFLDKGMSGDDNEESGSNRHAELHTPPMSPGLMTGVPTPMIRPETPTPRPATPGELSLSSSLDNGMVSSSLDTSSLVGSSSLANYGPPPTPMCPPRVGNLSSSSLVELPLSSATTTASAAPPLNILESDDDNVEICPDPFANNSTTSPDINDLPLSPPPLSASKHSLRLRIKPPMLRSLRSSPKSKSGKSKKPDKTSRKDKPKEKRGVLATPNRALSDPSGRPKVVAPSSSCFPSSKSSPSTPVFKIPQKISYREKSREQSAASPVQVTSTTASPPDISRDKTLHVRDGNIREIKLSNFMAYRDFSWKWNPNVNIIHGANGSGKSAITTALQLLFGDKASNTQRTSSVKNFVRKGYAFAYIEAKMTNYHGTLSKKIYGEQITLSRKIKIAGGSLYQIAGADKQMRKIKQTELTYVCQALQIDPNNPAQFLQQKSAESSKSGDQDKERFQKFKCSTQLMTKETLWKQSLENLTVAKESIRANDELRRFYALQTKQLQEQVDQIMKMEQSENRLQELNNEVRWSEVKVKEDELKEIKSQNDQTFMKCKELKDDKKKLEDEMANFSSLSEKNEEKMSEIKKKLRQLVQQKEGRMNELREVKRSQQHVNIEHSVLLDKIKELTKEISTLEGEMNADRRIDEEQNTKAQLEIQCSQESIQNKEAELEVLREKRDAIRGELDDFKARERQGADTVKKLESQLKQTKQELNKKDNFGKQMKEFRDRIDKCKSWIKTPTGPLGANVLVPDAKYAPLIEHILYSALFAFVVHNNEDFARLKAIQQEVYPDKGNGMVPPILIIPLTNVNDYMNKLKVMKDKLSGFRTVLSMLTIKDPIVEIGFVERIGCERIILFESNQQATMVLKDTKSCPSEVSSAYTLQWYKVTPFPRYQVSPLKKIKYNTDIIPMAKVEAALHINQEIAREREVMTTCRAHLRGHKEGGTMHPGLEKLLKMHDDGIQGLIKEITQLRNRIKHAENSIRQASVQSQDPKDTASDIKTVAAERAEREKDIQVLLTRLEEVKKEIGRIMKEKGEIESAISSLQENMGQLEEDQKRAHSTIEKIRKEVEGYKGHIIRLEKEFNQLSLHETKVLEDLNEKLNRATEGGQRPKILARDPEGVKRDLEDLKHFLENNSDKLRGKKRVMLEHKNSKALVEQITTEIDCINFLCDRLEPYIKVGYDCYEKMKKEMGILLKANYKALVEGHGLTGDVVIDWDQETLVFYVSPDQQADVRASKNYSKRDGEMVISDKQGSTNYFSNLSGGEKSKALVFYIMAIWKITDMPFHVLDEFETFQDDQSRVGIQDTLIKHARFHPDAQFFILTPLTLIDIPRNDPFVSVLYLKKKG